MRGFEPPTPCAQGRCATRLRYTPSCVLFAAIAGPACVTEHRQQSNATAARWVPRAQDFSTDEIAIPPGYEKSEFCRALPAHLVLVRGKRSIAMRETRGRFFRVVAFHFSRVYPSSRSDRTMGGRPPCLVATASMRPIVNRHRLGDVCSVDCHLATTNPWPTTGRRLRSGRFTPAWNRVCRRKGRRGALGKALRLHGRGASIGFSLRGLTEQTFSQWAGGKTQGRSQIRPPPLARW